MSTTQLPSGSKNHVKNVAIVGAAGTIGKHLVEQLLKSGNFEVTAITREGSPNTFSEGVKSAKVDYANHDSVVAALKGQDALIITMNVTASPETQTTLIKAAADAKVPWVLPNEWGEMSDEPASSEVFIGKTKTANRGLIESLGVSSWIGVANGFWYQFSLSTPGSIHFGIDIKAKTAQLFDNGNETMDVSTWPQIGRGVAKLLSLPVHAEGNELALEQYRNKFFNIKSFTINQRDMLDSILRVTGDKESDWTITTVDPEKTYHDGMKQLQSGDGEGFVILLYARYFYKGEPGSHTKRHGDDGAKLGLPKEDLDTATKEAVEMAMSGKGDY